MYRRPGLVSAFEWAGLLHEPFLGASKEPFLRVLSLQLQAFQGLLAGVLYRVQEQRDGRCRAGRVAAQSVSMRIMEEYHDLLVAHSLDVIHSEPQPRRAHNLHRSSGPKNPDPPACQAGWGW